MMIINEKQALEMLKNMQLEIYSNGLDQFLKENEFEELTRTCDCLVLFLMDSQSFGEMTGNERNAWMDALISLSRCANILGSFFKKTEPEELTAEEKLPLYNCN
jgi:hypothetical protein